MLVLGGCNSIRVCFLHEFSCSSGQFLGFFLVLQVEPSYQVGRGPCLSFPHATGQQKPPGKNGRRKVGGPCPSSTMSPCPKPLWGWWNPCCKDDSHVVEVVSFVLFHVQPYMGKMIQFDEYVSKGLKPPTSSGWWNFGESDSQQLAQNCVFCLLICFSQVRVVTSNRVCIFGNTGIVKFQKKKHERFVVFIEKSLQTVSLYHVEVDKVEGISERTSRHFLEEMSGGMDRYVRIRVSHLILLMQHPCWQIYPHHVYFPKSPSKPLDTTKSTPTVSNGDMRIMRIHVFVRNGCINAPVIVFLWIVYLVWSVMLGSLTNLTNGVWLQGLCRYSRYQLLILIKEQSWGASRRQVSQIV